jgi:hypothetical protein
MLVILLVTKAVLNFIVKEFKKSIAEIGNAGIYIESKVEQNSWF